MASNPIKVTVRSGLTVKVGRGPQGASGVTTVAAVHAATSKTTPVDADETMLVDSAATFGMKKLTFANLKVWVKSILGGAAQLNVGTTAGTVAAGDDTRIIAGGTAKQPGTTLAHYGITDAATSAQGSLAASASQPGHTHTALDCSAARAVEVKSETFSAVVGGQYVITGVAVLVGTPTTNASGGALTAGDSLVFWVAAGCSAVVFAPTSKACPQSLFPYRVVYDGAAWGIAAPYIIDALGFSAAASKGTVTALCSVVDDANTTISLADADSGTIKRCTAATAVAISVPAALAVGFNCLVIQAGAGQITFAGTGGATLNSYGAALKTAGQHASATIVRVASGVFNVGGNLTT